MTWADKLAKFLIELFTTHKFEELNPVEVTMVESMIIIILLLIAIIFKMD